MTTREKVTGPPTLVLFRGLNERDSEIGIEKDQSPDLLNVDPVPRGAIRSRRGFRVFTDAGGDPDIPAGSGALDCLLYLPKYTDSRNWLYTVRSGKLLQRVIAAGEEWSSGEFPVASAARYSSALARFYDGATDHGEALYVVNGENEPFILTGELEANWWGTTGTSITQLHGGGAGTTLEVEVTGHGLDSGSIIKLSSIADSDWSSLNGQVFRTETKDANTFYLLDASLTRQAVPVGETWGSPAGDGEFDSGFIGARRWPRAANGDGTPGSGVRGYPSRWDDPNEDGNTYWPRGNTQDWPSGLSRVGPRLHAYGFELDPERVDYSALEMWDHFTFEDIDEVSPTPNAALDGGFYYVHRGEGDKVTAVFQFDDYTIAMKTRKTVVFTGAAHDLDDVKVFPFGNANPRSWEIVGRDVYCWDPDRGPRRLSFVENAGDIDVASVGWPIPDKIAAALGEYKDQICCTHDVVNGRVIFWVPYDGSSTCEAALVYYYETDDWTFYTGRWTQISQAVYSHENRALYGARLNGEAVTLGVGSYDGVDDEDDQVAINAYYVTRWIFAPGIEYKERPVLLDVVYGEDGVGQSSVQIGYDYESTYQDIDTIDRQLGSPGSGYGSAVYGTAVYGESGRQIIRYRPLDLGFMLRLKFSNNATTAFGVIAAKFDLRAKGTR